MVTAETKSSQIFAEPLASEGEGSVFPVDLPMKKRWGGGTANEREARREACLVAGTL